MYENIYSKALFRILIHHPIKDMSFINYNDALILERLLNKLLSQI